LEILWQGLLQVMVFNSYPHIHLIDPILPPLPINVSNPQEAKTSKKLKINEIKN